VDAQCTTFFPLELCSMRQFPIILFLAGLLISTPRLGSAQVFGTVRVVARDAQGLAVANADVVVKDKRSAWSRTASTNTQGEALVAAVPFG